MSGLLPKGCQTINEAASSLIRADVGASHLAETDAELKTALDCIRREVEWLAARNDRLLRESKATDEQIQQYLNVLTLLLHLSPNNEVRINRMDVIAFAATADFKAEFVIESLRDSLNGDYIFRLVERK